MANVLRRIVSATHSHIDGRDLLAELHPRRSIDIKRRVDGVETWFEGDWLSQLWSAVKEAKALLYACEYEARFASVDERAKRQDNDDWLGPQDASAVPAEERADAHPSTPES